MGPRWQEVAGWDPEEANKYDLEDAFGKYGPVKNVWVARRPPGFGFVEMEARQDAEEAVRLLDGTKVAGARIKVQMSNGGKEKEWEDYRGRQEVKRERSRGEHCREGKQGNRSDERKASQRESRSE